jgi:hypothetical protein
LDIFKSVNLLNHKTRTIDKFEANRSEITIVAMVIIVLIIARIATVVESKQNIDSIVKQLQQ